MIRPSALGPCGLAPALAVQFPESSPAAEGGSEKHKQIAEGRPDSPEARAALAYLATRTVLAKERPIQLIDPEGGELLTGGTADVVFDDDGLLEVGDWKTGRPEFVTPPADNLQLHAYAMGLALEMGRDRYTVSLLFLDGERLHVARGPVVEGAAMWEMLDRLRTAAKRPPVAVPGEHCGRCWQRVHCDSYRARTATALTLLPQAGQALTLTDETATALALRIEAVEEACKLAKQRVQEHVIGGGRVEAGGKVYAPVTVAGRRSGPSVKDLETQGLGHLVKQGAPSTRWEWRRAS